MDTTSQGTTTSAQGSYWTVTSPSPAPAHVAKQNERYVNARCKCGAEKIVSVYSIKSGQSLSCGCRATERYRSVVVRNAPTELLVAELKRRNTSLLINQPKPGGNKPCRKAT